MKQCSQKLEFMDYEVITPHVPDTHDERSILRSSVGLLWVSYLLRGRTLDLNVVLQILPEPLQA